MAEKLSMKVLSGELDALRKRLREFETGFERKLEGAIANAIESGNELNAARLIKPAASGFTNEPRPRQIKE